MKDIEYRVRPVTRYSLTRWEQCTDGHVESGGCETLGEFDSEASAQRMLDAVANHENRPPGVSMNAEVNRIYWREP